VFIVPLELASLAGTLGGISQIAASAFGETGGSEAVLGGRRAHRSNADAQAQAQSPAPSAPAAAAAPAPSSGPAG
jgi:hypothetical protein